MGYCVEDNVVRVDIFKPYGKWSHSIALPWTGSYTECIHEAFKTSLEDYIDTPVKGCSKLEDFSGLTFVCLEPYHELSHPLILTIE